MKTHVETIQRQLNVFYFYYQLGERTFCGKESDAKLAINEFITIRDELVKLSREQD